MYASTAITAVTVQNTLGVTGVHAIPIEIIRAQIVAVLSDIGADAIKTGMLGSADAVRAVADAIFELAKQIPVVVDPVMVAKGGAALLEDDAVGALRERLLPMAALLTPNVPEAERLTGLTIVSEDDQIKAAKALLQMGAGAVLLKGGHRDGAEVTDVLLTDGGMRVFRAPRVNSTSTHGTGCTLASACAAGLAQGMNLENAVARAHAFVQEAIRTAPGFGAGSGPLNHLHNIAPYRPR